MTEVASTVSNVASTWIDGLIASNRGSRHAFGYAEKRYSYTDVAALMNRAGNLIKGLGVDAGAPVLLLLPGSPALVASLLGAIKAGAMPIVGVAADDAAAVASCVAATKPAAVVVHQKHFANVEAALAGVARERIVVVGGNAPGCKSFVDEIRGQSSWLAAEAVGADAPALGRWTGGALRTLNHAGFAALIEGSGTGALDGDTAPIAAMLRAFAGADEAALPA